VLEADDDCEEVEETVLEEVVVVRDEADEEESRESRKSKSSSPKAL
jgi:hypothetical protein